MARVQLLGPVWLRLILLRGSVSRQSQLCTDTEAVRCEVVSTHIQANTNRSRHVVLKNETKPRSLLLFCSWGRIYTYVDLYYQQQSNCVSSSAKRCCLSAGHTELHLGDELPPLWYLLSPRSGGRLMLMTPSIKQRKEQNLNSLSKRHVTSGWAAETMQDSWCLFSSFWELAGSGRTSAYMWRAEKTCFFMMGPLKSHDSVLKSQNHSAPPWLKGVAGGGMLEAEVAVYAFSTRPHSQFIKYSNLVICPKLQTLKVLPDPFSVLHQRTPQSH